VKSLCLKNNNFAYSTKFRSFLIQIIGIFVVFGFICFLYNNTQTNLKRQSIATGFDFLKQEAGFDIGESSVDYSASDTYSQAFFVGVINTLKVSFIGIILSTGIGSIVGIARLSNNWLVAKLASIYVEGLRNIPLLLQLFFFYTMFTEKLPRPRQALEPINGVFLCNRGLFFPIPEDQTAFLYIGISFIGACVIAWYFNLFLVRYQSMTGKEYPSILISVLICLSIPFAVWWILGMPRELDIPALRGFNFKGGWSLTPEFAALLLGLVFYTGAFIAEIVRSGIESVNRGQTEAGLAIGLKSHHLLNLIILPQALRVIIPPLTNQMLNLIKNSTLAVGIGYPDFVSVANTSINQTGQAIEGVLLIMGLYLFFSLVTSLLMNWYNKRIKW